MKLIKLTEFSQFKDGEAGDPWTIKDIVLGDLNLIVGMNAVGKTRLVNVLSNLAVCLAGKREINEAEWKLEFLNDKNEKVTYELSIGKHHEILVEKMIVGSRTVIDRSSAKITMYNAVKDEVVEVEPPKNKLLLNVRRDKKEHPYLEELYSWAANTYGFKLSSLVPENMIGALESFTGDPLRGFEYASHLVRKLNAASKKDLIIDLNRIGFKISDVVPQRIKGVPLDATFLHFVEKGLSNPLPQHQTSTGLLRAFMVLLVIQYSIENAEEQKTILIDDFTEGLDYQRSELLNKIVQEKIKDKKVQLIFTSNSQVLMNGIDVAYWNVLVRSGHIVKSYNYQNNKIKFDTFKETGLSNFRLFSSDFLANGKSSS